MRFRALDRLSTILCIAVHLLALLGTTPLIGQGKPPTAGPTKLWDPLPEDVWSMPPVPEGAVILRRRISIEGGAITNSLRIRVFAEEGKAAVQMDGLGLNVVGVAGRTVLPSGEEIPFKQGEDIQEKTFAELGKVRVRRASITPPGLTSNCLVDLEWREPYRDPRTRTFQPRELEIAGPFAAREVEIRIRKTLDASWYLASGRELKPQSTSDGTHTSIIYRDVPAQPELPLLLEPTRQMPRLRIYDLPGFLWSVAKEDKAQFWNAVAKWRLAWTEPYTFSAEGAFMQLRGKILVNLPEGAQDRARVIYRRVREAIRNVDSESWEESHGTIRPPEQEYLTYQQRRNLLWDGAKRLDWVVSRGYGNSGDLKGLTLQMFHQAKVPFRVVQTSDMFVNVVRSNLLDPDQFSLDLARVEEVGREPLWLHLGSRWSPPGLLQDRVLGNAGMMWSPSDGKAEFLVLPSSNASENHMDLMVRIEPGPAADTIHWDAEVIGIPAYDWRVSLMSHPDQERRQAIKEILESETLEIGASAPKIEGLMDPERPMGMHLVGHTPSSEGDGSRVNPFPGLKWWMFLPGKAVKTRPEPFFLGFPRSLSATSTVRVPVSLRAKLPAEATWSNAVGSVTWTNLEPLNPSEVRIQVKAELSTMALPATEENRASVREFLGWWQDVLERRIEWVTR
ncbi:MAG TPA: hypothetical protein VJ623_12355 [Holophagaceae bacterium]|nr:hypothetical protein [Holophagaceae bacterium]